METLNLKLTLLSDATFGRGDGVPGLVDAEVEHDHNGLPYLRGRTLKGLLGEEGANILFALEQFSSEAQLDLERWRRAAQQLFGRPGSTEDNNACLHVGDARLPADLRAAIAVDLGLKSPKYTPTDALDAITAIRRQTAMDESGVPDEGSLRAMRVILRGTPFVAALYFTEEPIEDTLALLSACVMALRRVGTGRNRGRGRVTARLYTAQGQDVTCKHLAHFEREVRQ
jgi:CRISPR/Cas system CSM-associated protein Csm3 (group 7 of RAMP superfamily)